MPKQLKSIAIKSKKHLSQYSLLTDTEVGKDIAQ